MKIFQANGQSLVNTKTGVSLSNIIKSGDLFFLYMGESLRSSPRILRRRLCRRVQAGNGYTERDPSRGKCRSRGGRVVRGLLSRLPS